MARTTGLKIATTAALAAGAAALAVPGTGAGAAPGFQDDRLGAAVQNNASPAEIQALLNQTAALKPKVVRLNFFWGRIAPTKPARPRNHNDPAYNWTAYDQIITGLRRRGIRPLLVMWDIPFWANRKQPPTLRGLQVPWNPHAPRRPKDFADFAYAAAERYDGTKPNPNGPPARLGRVNMWEPLNEPNLKSFFRRGSRSNLAYAKRLHKAAYAQIKRANRRAIVITSGPGPNSSGRNGNISARAWLNGWTRDRSLKAEGIGWHVYPGRFGPRSRNRGGVFPRWGDNRRGRGGAREMLSIRRRAKSPMIRRAPIYITEAGYTTARTPFRASSVTRRQQATYLRQMFALPLIRRAPFALIIQFNVVDNINWPGGFFTASGQTKPSLRAWRSVARKRLTAFERRSIR